MFDKKSGYALVLAGGGARGAYEIGAWRALRELNIRIDAVGGASVGALNAAVVAQDDYRLGERIWLDLTIDKVVDIPAEMMKNGRPRLSFRNLAKIVDLHLDIKNLGLDPSPLHNLLKTEVDETKIRRSGIDLGIVTLKVDSFSPCEIFLDEMPDGTLPDYLLASASFPAFKRAEINGKQFADGGIYDNIPHSMMKNRGCRRIIVVDIGGLGVNKRPDVAGTETIYIKNSISLGNILDFNPDNARTAMEVGYLDTMKVFEKNDGLKYFIKRDKKLEEKLTELLFRPENIEKYRDILNLKHRKCTPENAELLIREIMPPAMKSNRNLILCMLESAGYALGVDRTRHYKLAELLEAVKQRHAEIMQSGRLPSEKESQSFFNRIEEAIEETIELFRSEKDIGDYCPYEYAKIMRNRKAAYTLIPELRAAEIFLAIL